jgi:hypothetical protein
VSLEPGWRVLDHGMIDDPDDPRHVVIEHHGVRVR